MIRTEFNVYDDGAFYFLYVTDEVRIETDGVAGLVMETGEYIIRSLGSPFKYLTIKQNKDEYFNESLLNPYIDTVIKAAEMLYRIFNDI